MDITYYIIPLFLAFALILGIRKNSYGLFIKGAKDGIDVALSIFPYILAMIFATKLLEASMFLMYLFKNSDLPYLLILEGFFRPLSNNASLSVLIEIFVKYGVDSKVSLVGSILQGATETSFYIISVYYGAIGIKKYPYSLIMAIISDVLIFLFSVALFYFIL
jgi:spore maturation protein B